jgi:hypothetical protein
MQITSETDPGDLVVGTIKGVFALLDPFSQYIGEICKRMKNKIGGIYSGTKGIRG